MKNILPFNRNARIITWCIMILCCFSCKKVLDTPLPSSQILVSEAYKDDGTATSGVLSIYSTAMTVNPYFWWGPVTLNTSLYADDIQPVTNLANNYYTNNLTRAGTEANTMMQGAYLTILYINTSLEQLLASKTLTPSTRQQLLGECYFLRAFTYYYIVNYWGKATALVLSSDVNVTKLSPSTSISNVYTQIIADLKLAQANLTTSYPATDKGRPNVYAADALLARVYLYLGQNNDAITQANAVINSGQYTPLPSPTGNFLKTSNEAIWSLQPQVIGGTIFVPTPDAGSFIPFLAGFIPPNYCLTTSLLNAFEPGDLRRTNWVGTATVLGSPTIYSIPKKYKQQQISGSAASVTENYVMLRAAELYLILAEAYYNNKDIPNAVNNLNVVRTRAGLAGLSTTITADQCRAAIEQENRIEFFAELGHRFFDLKRWPGIAGKAWRSDEVLPVTKAGVPTFTWATYKNVFPLADKDVQADPKLVQNPGY